MTNTRTHRRHVGELLTEEGVITNDQLDEALQTQAKSGGLLGLILMDMGLITETDIARVTCVQLQLPFISLHNYECETKLVELFDREFLHEHQLFPFDKVGKTLLMMVTEIPTETVLTAIPQQSGMNAGLYVGFLSEVAKQLETLIPLSAEQKVNKIAKAKQQAAPALSVADASSDDDGLIFSSSDSKSLLDELDSTWDAIFTQLDGDEE